MKLNPIINSLLETDMYKFSMTQAVYHMFSDYKTTWTFKCRNKDVFFTAEMVDEIKEQIKHYCSLAFTDDALEYLNNIKWIKGSYVDFLRLWRPRFEDFELGTDAECGLTIETKGTWLNTSMYEIPTLAIVNEVYFRMAYNYDELFASFKEKCNGKVARIKLGNYKLAAFSEFGLRRRLSAEAQEYAVKKLAENRDLYLGSTFIGTSNVYLAKKYNLTPVGTMAHEWIMCVGQGNHKHNPAYSNWYAFDAWVKEYGVLNGIALTDTITTDCFLKDFQLTYATLFSGVRHDSGDPIDWGEKMIAHYKSLGIDPMTKTLLFSDSLNFEKADKIRAHFEGRAKVAFGIGTYLSNDTCVPALNIVMKVTKCNGQDAAKISDTPGKGMCKNQNYVNYLQRCIDWRMVTLYGIAALLGDARVVCTDNRSESFLGWSTKFGDMAGDFAPIANLTVREVKQLGYELGISESLIEKKPDDGMCGATDEEKFGFTYEELDDYILSEGKGQPLMKLEHLEKIQKMHKASRHKFDEMPKFRKD